MSSREFNHDTASAKKAATQGPVIITDRGRPTHVLLTFERYQELSGSQPNIVALLSTPSAGSIDFDPPRMGSVAQPVDLS